MINWRKANMYTTNHNKKKNKSEGSHPLPQNFIEHNPTSSGGLDTTDVVLCNVRMDDSM